MAVRKDIFMDRGRDYYYPASVDFNAYHSVEPGDVVIIPEGQYGSMEIFNAKGITFITEGVAQFKFISFYEGTEDMSLQGDLNVDHGLVLSDPNHFGGLFNTTGKLSFQGVRVTGSMMGLQVVNKPGAKTRQPFTDLSMQDVLIEDVKQEGIYVGHDSLGGPWIKGIYRNVVTRRTGRDGIQTRNGFHDIQYCIVEDTGLAGEAPHAHGILFGGNTNGGICQNNKLSGVGGIGIFINGFGDFDIYNNDVEAKVYSLFTKNAEGRTADLQKVGYQQFDISWNKFKAASGQDIVMYDDPASGIKTSVQIGSNEISGKVDIAATIMHPTAPRAEAQKPAKKLIATMNLYDDNSTEWIVNNQIKPTK
jgi:hypothetical protein